MHLHFVTGIVGSIKEFVHKLLDNINRQPSRAEPDGNLAGSQILWLYLFESLHIDSIIFGIQLCGFSRYPQLFTDISGEVFVCHQILS